MEQGVPARPSPGSSSQSSLPHPLVMVAPQIGCSPRPPGEGAQHKLREGAGCSSRCIRKLRAGPFPLTHTVNLNLSLNFSLLTWPGVVRPPTSQNTVSYIPIAFGLTSQQTLNVPGLLPSILFPVAFQRLGPGRSKQAQFGFPHRMLSLLGPLRVSTCCPCPLSPEHQLLQHVPNCNITLRDRSNPPYSHSCVIMNFVIHTTIHQ